MVDTVSGNAGGSGRAELHRAERSYRKKRTLYWRWLVMLACLFALPAIARSADASPEVPAGKDGAASESGYYHTRCHPRGVNGTFIPAETLEGVLLFEIGELDWGRPDASSQNGAPMKDNEGAAGP